MKLKTDAQLTAERDRLAAEMKRVHARWCALRGRKDAVERELRARDRRAALEPLIGVPEAVKLAYREGSKLDDALGTITAIRRTRATVEYAQHGSWNIPLDRLIPAAADQGFTMTLGRVV